MYWLFNSFKQDKFRPTDTNKGRYFFSEARDIIYWSTLLQEEIGEGFANSL